MKYNKIVKWILSFLEFLPLAVFTYLGRLEADISQRFIWGAAAVIVIVPLLFWFRHRLNPLLVGVNIWLVFQATFFFVAAPKVVEVLLWLRESSFFLAIIFVSMCYLAFTNRTLLTAEENEFQLARKFSLVMLVITAAAFLVSFANRGDELWAGVVPGTIVFVAQLLLNKWFEWKAEN